MYTYIQVVCVCMCVHMWICKLLTSICSATERGFVKATASATEAKYDARVGRSRNFGAKKV